MYDRNTYTFCSGTVAARCSPQDEVFSVTDACAVKVSSSLIKGVYVGSVTFLLRKIPTGFYRFSFSTPGRNFKSNVFQIFVHNPVSAPPTPQSLIGQELTSAIDICTNSLFRLLKSIGLDDAIANFTSDAIRANHVFRGNLPLTSTEGFVLSDVHFKLLPPFFVQLPPTIEEGPRTDRRITASLSSSGSAVFLSAPANDDSVFPIVWHLHQGASNLLCVANQFGGNARLNWMSSGVTSTESLQLTKPAITIMSASVQRDIPNIVPLSVTLNVSSTFVVRVTYRCDECARAKIFGVLEDLCFCKPTLFVRVVSLDATSRCSQAVISARSFNGLNAFASPSCFLGEGLVKPSVPLAGVCEFTNLVIDSATFGCSYQLEVINPYNNLNSVLARSSRFRVCSIFPKQLSDAPTCSPLPRTANYSAFTWSGVFLPQPPSDWSSGPSFIDITRSNEILTSVQPGSRVPLVVNVCGASVFSSTSSSFQPKRPVSFSNRDTMQLQVDIFSTNLAASTNRGRSIATCSLLVTRGLQCTAIVTSGNCIVSPMPNKNSCISDALPERAFFCQTQFNPKSTMPRVADLQLQLFFNDVIPAVESGNFKIEVGGSGSDTRLNTGRDWGYTAPKMCAVIIFLFCLNFRAC